MQPVGGEHALAVEHPTRSRFRTADPAVRAANDCVQPKRDRPRRERPSGLTPTGPCWRARGSAQYDQLVILITSRGSLTGQRLVRFERLHLAGLRQSVPHLADRR